MLNDAVVPWTPSLTRINTEQVRATRPVLASSLRAGAEAANWVVGKGRAVAVDGPRIVANSEAGISKKFRYWVHGNEYATDYQLQITMSGQSVATGGPTPIYGNLVLPIGGTSYPFAVDGTPSTFVLRIPRSYPPSAASEEVSFELDVDLASVGGSTGQFLFVHHVHIFESYQIRVGAPGGSYAGVDYFSLDPKSPIYDGAPDTSIAGLSGNIDSAQQFFHRRGSLFTWTSYFTDQALADPTTTSTSYVDLFALNPALQSFLTSSGQTFRDALVNIYARVDNGSGGTGVANVRFTMTNGSSTVFTVSSLTSIWHTERVLAVEVDDPSRWVVDGGIRGGTRDLMRCEIKVNAGGYRLWIAGISVHDVPG